MKKTPPTNQWMMSLLVNGFHAPCGDSASERVRNFRHEKLRRMVLHSLYGSPDDPDYRKRAMGSRGV